MDNTQFTPNKLKNKHLTQFERGQISILSKQGNTPYAIAQLLNRASNTIRNELKRGTVPQIKNNKDVFIYYPDVGQRVYEQNRKHCGCKYKILKCEVFIAYVEDKVINEKLSIDSIRGRIGVNNKFTKEQVVCTKTLYNYVDLGLLKIKNIDLPVKVKRKTKPSYIRRHKRILGRSIDERPAIINERTEFGHWEIDTVIGKKTKGDEALLTLVERVSRKDIVRKIPAKTSECVMMALKNIQEELKDDFSKIFKSITSDNGSEFAELANLEESTNTVIYFAHPYRSGERGSNERHNGLIRRFIPKGKAISQYSVDFIARVEDWCNTLPRKVLNYYTPDEVFDRYLNELLAS